MALWVVVGGQYGSEGKGKVSAFITKQENIDVCVRCGGPNSGHSFVDDAGKNIVLRQIPTGFINPHARLLIPAGALIDPIVLKQEIDALRLSPGRVGIDSKAFVIEESDKENEKALGLRERLSSTLCGVGSALARRVMRGENARIARDLTVEHPWITSYLTDASAEVNQAIDRQRKVLIEGTQGFGLSLYHSDHYPKTTSRDTTAAGFISEVGVSPRDVTEIVVVFRTFPIRVAGAQAGPLKNEISWELLRKESQYPYHIEETTTVTQKVRRIARFDWALAKRAIQANKPTRLAINGLDYLSYTDTHIREKDELSSISKKFLDKLSKEFGIHLSYLGIGPPLDKIIHEGIEDKSLHQGMALDATSRYASTK